MNQKTRASSKLMITLVEIGKSNVKFFFCTTMSPGRRPSHGSLPEIVKTSPRAIMTAPMSMSDLPNCSTFVSSGEVASPPRNMLGTPATIYFIISFHFRIDASAIFLTVEIHLFCNAASFPVPAAEILEMEFDLILLLEIEPDTFYHINILVRAYQKRSRECIGLGFPGH